MDRMIGAARTNISKIHSEGKEISNKIIRLISVSSGLTAYDYQVMNNIIM
jgi:hypothetical protein